nr:MAG TPA: hypothetical protein [Caudoviricetes sp.]
MFIRTHGNLLHWKLHTRNLLLFTDIQQKYHLIYVSYYNTYI